MVCFILLCKNFKIQFHGSLPVPLGELEGLSPQPKVIKMFEKGCFSYDDFLNLSSSCRNASAPVLNGITYKVYKKCSKLSKFIFHIFKCAFSNGEIPLLQWCSAREICILKSKTPSENLISDFQPIAPLNVEGKLFFSLISKWLVSDLVQNNKIINLSVQKGCMEKVTGSCEHLSMVWSVLKEARVKKSWAVSIWLDIANAYGSIPHKLIFFALQRCGIPKQWIQIVESYYVEFLANLFQN